MDLTEKKTGGREIYSGHVVHLYVDDILLPDGGSAKREVLRHSGAVCIAPVNSKRELLFVRQFRYAVGRELLELPAGRIDAGEDPQLTGIRELREETGYIAHDVSYVGRLFPTPGYSDEVIWLYVCTVDSENVGTDTDDGEFVDTVAIPFDKAVEMVMNDELFDSKTQILLLRLNEAVRIGKIFI